MIVASQEVVSDDGGWVPWVARSGSEFSPFKSGAQQLTHLGPRPGSLCMPCSCRGLGLKKKMFQVVAGWVSIFIIHGMPKHYCNENK